MSYFFSAKENSFFHESIKGSYLSAGTWPTDAKRVSDDIFKEYGVGIAPAGMMRGTDSNGLPAWVSKPIQPNQDLAAQQRTEIEDARKAAEADGVTVNAIRYAGDAGNRAALREAIDFADAQGLATFASWKDSDDVFHTDHPVADVRQALNDIAARRGQLIAREGELVAQINAAEAADDRAGIEAVTRR